MARLSDIVAYCDERLRRAAIKDFPGADNGLQVDNDGSVSRIGAAVDAGRATFAEAARRGIDLLLVHHGLFWTPPLPVTGVNREKLKLLMDNNIALYSSHLPLDCHPEIGNNARLAADLDLPISTWAIEHQGTPIAAVCEPACERDGLRARLEERFENVIALEFGPAAAGQIAIITGSGGSALPELAANGIGTLITGELKQSHFNQAQELGLNVYACGHYATETYGVQALAAELSERFGLPWEFIDTACPL